MRHYSRVAVLLSLIATWVAEAAAQEPRLYARTGKFDDVRFELANAIVARGLVADTTGKISDMLTRTGADVGSTVPIYSAAEYFSFCSAKLSRAMMEADPSNIAFCPYVMFVYETVAKPGEIVVGFRPPAARGSEASQAALKAVEALLDGIARDAVN